LRRTILPALISLLALTVAARADIEERPDLGRYFEDAGTHGTVAVQEAGGTTIVFDPERASRAYLPASTFKVPAALIALETGVVKDANKDILPWNGVEWIVPACNQDQTLASALKRSCMPIFAALMQRVGDRRLNESLAAFDYGNADASGGYPYWIKGNLRTSAMEQIAFLDRLRRGALPASAAHMQAVGDMLVLEEGDGYVLRGKTGWVGAPGPGVGWLVGWVEGEGKAYLFALNLDITERSHADARLSIVKAVLKQIGAMP
jgi:beta-lactamase class D